MWSGYCKSHTSLISKVFPQKYVIIIIIIIYFCGKCNTHNSTATTIVLLLESFENCFIFCSAAGGRGIHRPLAKSKHSKPPPKAQMGVEYRAKVCMFCIPVNGHSINVRL